METHTTTEIVKISVNPHTTTIVKNSKRMLRYHYDEYMLSKAALHHYTEAYLAMKKMTKMLYEGVRIPDDIFKAKSEARRFMREAQVVNTTNKKIWKFLFHGHLKHF